MRWEFLKLQNLLEIEELKRFWEMNVNPNIVFAKNFNVADYPVEKLVFDPETIIPNEDTKATTK